MCVLMLMLGFMIRDFFYSYLTDLTLKIVFQKLLDMVKTGQK